MNVRTATGGILSLLALLVTRGLGASIADPSTLPPVPAHPMQSSAIVTCAVEVYPNRTLPQLYPVSQYQLPVDNITLYKERQKEEMAAFCSKPDLSRYTTCVQSRLQVPRNGDDAFAGALVNVEEFGEVFEFYCNHTDLILEQFECTLAEETATPCNGGGSQGMAGQDLLYKLCVGLVHAEKCRFDICSRCDTSYANIMRSFYRSLFKACNVG